MPSPWYRIMMNDKSIAGLPFKPDEALRPGMDQLKGFLETDGRVGNLELYRRLIERADAFDEARLTEAKQEDISAQMADAVLRYARFADRNVLSALELYQYHLHTFKLKSLDISAPASFIKSAEKTISRLNKDKLDDVLRMARLQEMINERKKIIEKSGQPSAELTAELCRIALYIRNCLAGIDTRCEAAIALLSDAAVIGRKENQMIEDIKERPQKALRAGKIMTQDLDRAVREVSQIADRMVSVVKEDIAALKGHYEAIQGRLKEMVQMIDASLVEVKTKKSRSLTEDQQLFDSLGKALVSYLSKRHFDQKTPGLHIETAYEKFITQKRKEMLDYLFAVLQRDRRTLPDRRSPAKRRKTDTASIRNPERRNGKDRRTGKKRRKTVNSSS
jgi:hypothetical protein